MAKTVVSPISAFFLISRSSKKKAIQEYLRLVDNL